MLEISDLVTAHSKIEALKGVSLRAEAGRITCMRVREVAIRTATAA